MLITLLHWMLGSSRQHRQEYAKLCCVLATQAKCLTLAAAIRRTSVPHIAQLQKSYLPWMTSTVVTATSSALLCPPLLDH